MAPPQRHFLLIDADDLQRMALAEQLARGMDCTTVGASSIGEAQSAIIRSIRFDAMILDVDLPDGDGRDFCQRLRRTGVNVPLLILTDAERETDVVRGLDSGANDYIIRPVGTPQLLARLRAQLRAFEASEHAEIGMGPFVFRPGAKLLHRLGSKPIRLTEKEVGVLKYLYRAEGAPVTREMLLQDVWGYNADATTHTVETHIYRLRRKIHSAAEGERLVVNDGGGYRLCLGRPRPAPALRRPVPELAAFAMAS